MFEDNGHGVFQRIDIFEQVDDAFEAGFELVFHKAIVALVEILVQSMVSTPGHELRTAWSSPLRQAQPPNPAIRL